MSRVRKSQLSEARYFNRELSWLQFNARVLNEAESNEHPLLERLRFLSIFDSNLDEFYMVRVSGLVEQFEGLVQETSPDGLTPAEQLKIIARAAFPLRRRASDVFEKVLRPNLALLGIKILPYDGLSAAQKAWLEAFYCQEVFPVCTPLMLQPATSVPFISGLSLNLAVELFDGAETRLARVKIPTILPRAVKLKGRKPDFVMLEEVIAANLASLFPGVEIVGAHLFRVIRDADIEIRKLEAADLIATVEETVRQRRFGDPVLLQIQDSMPDHVRLSLMRMLRLDAEDVMELPGLLGLDVLNELVQIDRPSLRFSPYTAHVAEALSSTEAIFETIRSRDVLLHHPYDSFRPVELFAESAASDPKVIGIKQTLYRVGDLSPIVDALLDAAEEGKQVAAMVELKARFDESNNIVWARSLERAGAHVTYGFPETKVHCKLCLVVRREQSGIETYAHIGTGNYNPTTARQYTDLSLFTCDPDITQDVSELFNYLTGFSKQVTFRKLLVAPLNLREAILVKIRAQRAKGAKGLIRIKVNSLVDPEVIEALYSASQAGVVVELVVRGACCLKPGVRGLSESIRVVSIVGRFLEHSRIYWFGQGESAEVLIGSADLMRRNLDRRIEVLAPVESPPLKEYLSGLFDACLADNERATELQADGTYAPLKKRRRKAFDSQRYFMKHSATQSLFEK